MKIRRRGVRDGGEFIRGRVGDALRLHGNGTAVRPRLRYGGRRFVLAVVGPTLLF